MRIFITCIILFLCNSCKSQNNQKLQLELDHFFKIDDQDILYCKGESEKLQKQNKAEWLVKNIYDQCVAHYEYLNFYKYNTLKMLEKTSNKNDFLIINYISDNSYIPYRTKTILKIDNNYNGLKHYFEDVNNEFVYKNEEFEVSKSDIESIGKIDDYLKTGKSEYVGEKSAGLIGNNTHWYVISKNNGKFKMIQLFRTQ